MGSLLGQRLTEEVLSIGNNEHKDDGGKKGSNQGAQPVAVEDNPQILLDQSPCLADKHHLLDGKGSLTVGQDPGPSSSCMYRPGRECTVDSRQRKSKNCAARPSNKTEVGGGDAPRKARYWGLRLKCHHSHAKPSILDEEASDLCG